MEWCKHAKVKMTNISNKFHPFTVNNMREILIFTSNRTESTSSICFYSRALTFLPSHSENKVTDVYTSVCIRHVKRLSGERTPNSNQFIWQKQPELKCTTRFLRLIIAITLIVMRFIFFRFIAQNCLAIAFKCNPLSNRHHQFQPISSTLQPNRKPGGTHIPNVWQTAFHALYHSFGFSISICVYVFHMQFQRFFLRYDTICYFFSRLLLLPPCCVCVCVLHFVCVLYCLV